MSVAGKQDRCIEELMLIEDPLERLDAVVERGRWEREFLEEERRDELLVRGCVSRVWLEGRCEGGRCHFRLDADSPVVKGLGRLLAEIYSGEAAGEVVSVEPELVRRLGLAGRLSATRLQGLERIRDAIRGYAQQCLGGETD